MLLAISCFIINKKYKQETKLSMCLHKNMFQTYGDNCFYNAYLFV